MGRTLRLLLSTFLTALILAACGGGASDSSTLSPAAATAATSEPSAPQATGDTATDGLNWFNFRRGQLGLAALTRNPRIDAAALGHSNYQKANNVITHEQTQGNPGFTGVTVADRLNAAGYTLPRDNYAYGEVISSTSSTSGFKAGEDLIAAIYHRLLVFEPMFKEAGVGAATVSGGATYFTTEFAAIGLDAGLGSGNVVTYPFNGQQRVPVNFFSDNESPDPVPGRNEVGYPISVHANIVSNVVVDSFTVRARGGQNLPVQLLVGVANPKTPNVAVDPHAAPSAAAIIPLDPLSRATTYDVQFTGTVDGVPVSRSWSFTTQ